MSDNLRSHPSVLARERGNAFYLQAAQSEHLAPCLQLSYLEKARREYQTAIDKADSQLLLSSALKNVGAMCEKSFRVHTGKPSVCDISKSFYFFTEGLEFYMKALVIGEEHQPLAWHSQVQGKISTFLEYALFLAREDGDLCGLPPVGVHAVVRRSLHRKLVRHNLADRLSPVTMARVWTALLQDDVNEAVRALDKEEFSRGFNRLMDAEQPLRTARQYLRVAEKLGEHGVYTIEEMIESAEEQISMARVSSQSRKLTANADAFVEKAVNEAEEIDVDQLWVACDLYKQAILCAEKLDMESESVAAAMLGRLLHRCMKLNDAGHKYYRHAIDGAAALHPRQFHQCVWYQHAMNGLNDLQKEIWEKDAKKKDEERKPILEELKEELEAIKKAADESAYKLLAHLFETHIPKVEGWKKPVPATAENGKKQFLDAIRWYHPDKNTQHGLKWEVLCEEITKHLNAKYVIFKT